MEDEDKGPLRSVQQVEDVGEHCCRGTGQTHRTQNPWYARYTQEHGKSSRQSACFGLAAYFLIGWGLEVVPHDDQADEEHDRIEGHDTNSGGGGGGGGGEKKEEEKRKHATFLKNILNGSVTPTPPPPLLLP